MGKRREADCQPHRQDSDGSFTQGLPLQTGLRVLFLPLFAARAVMLLPASVFFKERLQSPYGHTAQQDTASTLQRLRGSCGLSLTSDVSLVVPRIAYCSQDWGLAWHAAVYNISGGLVRILAAEKAVASLRRWLERFANTLIGRSWWQAAIQHGSSCSRAMDQGILI